MVHAATPDHASAVPAAQAGRPRTPVGGHYENNYGGAVRRLNAIERRFEEVDWSTAPVFDINGLKREEAHRRQFGDLARDLFRRAWRHGRCWRRPGCGARTRFRQRHRMAVSLAPRRKAGGSGWTLLTWSERHQRLMIQWAQDHTNCLAGSVPILALDMYEHAYHIDFGSKAGAYVDAFMKNIHWDRVGRRFQHIAERHQDMTPPSETVRGIAPEDLLARFQQQEDILLLDICSPKTPRRGRYAGWGAVPGAGRDRRMGKGPAARETGRGLLPLACRQAAMSQQNSTASALMRRCCPAD